MKNIEQNNIWLVLLGVILAVNLFFGIYSFVGVIQLNTLFRPILNSALSGLTGGSPSVEANNVPRQQEVAAAESGPSCVSGNIDLDSDPSIGDPNAPVVIVEYSDFECPFCARFVNGAYSQLKSEYIDTGLVRLVYKDFPLESIHPIAAATSVIANCVYQEFGSEAFFELHDRIYLQQSELNEENLENWALEAGFTKSQFDACLNDSELQDEVVDDIAEASALGINGTPSFVVNGELIVGAQPFGVFQSSIEASLNGNSQCSFNL